MSSMGVTALPASVSLGSRTEHPGCESAVIVNTLTLKDVFPTLY